MAAHVSLSTSQNTIRQEMYDVRYEPYRHGVQITNQRRLAISFWANLSFSKLSIHSYLNLRINQEKYPGNESIEKFVDPM